ncbi:hypothetical protein PInf_000087 [Phytophthora infestans]|nr:hypothetical protein PInf_000087 [Phytophthora infestans]
MAQQVDKDTGKGSESAHDDQVVVDENEDSHAKEEDAYIDKNDADDEDDELETDVAETLFDLVDMVDAAIASEKKEKISWYLDPKRLVAYYFVIPDPDGEWEQKHTLRCSRLVLTPYEMQQEILTKAPALPAVLPAAPAIE